MPYTTLVSAPDLARYLNSPDWLVVDCRFDLTNTQWGQDAYRESHIPGAIYAPFMGNLTPDGLFLDQEALRKRFLALLGDTQSRDAICYCGSGVTATHNVLAMLHAGLGDARLYAGSLSHWITDPNRPVATGEK